jgi:hypothetical protein
MKVSPASLARRPKDEHEAEILSIVDGPAKKVFEEPVRQRFRAGGD